MLLETVNVNGLTGRIHTDEDAESPREWDNLAKFICFHGRYNLGDKHDYRSRDYTGWAELKSALLREDPKAEIVPLYLFDHSGITMSTRPFSCPWDSGQVGFAVVPGSRIREEYGVKRINRKIRDLVREIIESEVETYDTYLRGDVYGYMVGGEDADSCWGIFGLDSAREALAEAMGAAA